MLDSAILWIDYEKSPFFLRETRANETRARVKIYLREKGETSRWREFHARSRLARSTIAEEKWGLLLVYPLDKSLSSCYVLWKSVAFSTGWIAECKGIRGIPEPGNVCSLNPESQVVESGISTTVEERVVEQPNRFFGVWELPCMKAGIRDFKVKWERDSGYLLLPPQKETNTK